MQRGCSMCGQEFAEEDLIPFEGSLVCAGCKPAFIQQIKENAEISGTCIARYAGFWRRWAAILIDGIVTGLVTWPTSFALQGLFPKAGSVKIVIPVIVILYLISFLVPALYSIILHGKYGATPGKKALKIKVVMSDGQPITYGRATGRYFAHMLSAMVMYIGYIMAGFDQEKRALHDHVCNTRVVFN